MATSERFRARRRAVTRDLLGMATDGITGGRTKSDIGPRVLGRPDRVITRPCLAVVVALEEVRGVVVALFFERRFGSATKWATNIRTLAAHKRFPIVRQLSLHLD